MPQPTENSAEPNIDSHEGPDIYYTDMEVWNRYRSS